MIEITQEKLQALLNYNPETGVFTWVQNRRGKAKAGTIAGSLDTKGRRQIKVFGTMYFAHRLAFVWMLNKWPDDQVDHIDRNPANNAWANLREATGVQNSINRLSNRSGLPKGVYPLPSGRFFSVIGSTYLGSFDTVEEAAKTFSEAAYKRDSVFIPPEINTENHSS